MIIAGIDIETTGFDDTSEIVEVGYCIYDSKHNVVLSAGSELFEVDKWSADAEKHHRIKEEYTKIARLHYDDINLEERILNYNPSVMIAHNASHDYGKVVKAWPKLHKKEITWLCSLEDLPHIDILGTEIKSKKLMHLAIDYGIPVTGWHRAMIDAEIACRIASKHDLHSILANINQPKLKLIACGQYSTEANKYLKANHFKWDPENKLWHLDNLTNCDKYRKELKQIVPGWTIKSEVMPLPSYR